LYCNVYNTNYRRKLNINVEEHSNDHRATKTVKRLALKPSNALQQLKASITSSMSISLENIPLSVTNEDAMYVEFRDELDVYSTLKN